MNHLMLLDIHVSDEILDDEIKKDLEILVI